MTMSNDFITYPLQPVDVDWRAAGLSSSKHLHNLMMDWFRAEEDYDLIYSHYDPQSASQEKRELLLQVASLVRELRSMTTLQDLVSDYVREGQDRAAALTTVNTFFIMMAYGLREMEITGGVPADLIRD